MRRPTTCLHCDLPGHRRDTCHVLAQRRLKPDAIDVAVSALDLVALRDRPADLRLAIVKLVRRMAV